MRIKFLDILWILIAGYFFGVAGILWTLIGVLAVNHFIDSKPKILRDPFNLEEYERERKTFENLTKLGQLLKDKVVIAASKNSLGKFDNSKLHEYILTKDQSVYEYSGVSNKNSLGAFTFVPNMETELLMKNGLIYTIVNKNPNEIEFNP